LIVFTGPGGASLTDARQLATLRESFDVVRADDADAYSRLLRQYPEAMVLGPAGQVSGRAQGTISSHTISRDAAADGQSLDATLESIDRFGADLLQFDTSLLSSQNMADRLQHLMSKVSEAVKRILRFDHFELRLINRRTGQLELVAAIGMAPLRIGETISVGLEGNGISGYVAATGRSYICNDISKDPMYREGLDQAASSLTVPLRLHDRVIGVFNAESTRLNAFSEIDRQLAELFGHYIAMALHVLDLLVVERFTTSERLSGTIMDELKGPLDDISLAASELRGAAHELESPARDARSSEAGKDGAVSPATDPATRIMEALEQLRDRIRACASGPQTILAADQALRKHETDPRIAGKRILVADDQPAIRDIIGRILRNRGAEVTVCATGLKTLEELAAATARGGNFDLVISDIRMPDRNGYEIFRATKAANAATPVILMTGFGYDPHHCIVRASQEGMHCFLFKPFKASQLLEEVRKALVAASSTTTN
jgi:CheY-like chemotaxis protein/putative methionine-R-sulfoxide reductase with GAF domain